MCFCRLLTSSYMIVRFHQVNMSFFQDHFIALRCIEMHFAGGIPLCKPYVCICVPPRFCRCGERAWKASLALVAFASGIKEQMLECTYRKLCQDEPGLFDICEDDIHEEEEEPDEIEAKEDAECEGNDCMKLISCIQRETLFVDQNFEDDMELGQGTGNQPEDIAGGEELKALLEKLQPDMEPDTKSKGATSGERMPSTLLEAVQDTGDRFNALFRLAVRLRSAIGGADTQWISNARNARRTSSKLNWHQHLGQLFSKGFPQQLCGASFSGTVRVRRLENHCFSAHFTMYAHVTTIEL